MQTAEHVYSKVIYHTFSFNGVLMNNIVGNFSTRIRNDMLQHKKVFDGSVLVDYCLKMLLNNKLKGIKTCCTSKSEIWKEPWDKGQEKCWLKVQEG